MQSQLVLPLSVVLAAAAISRTGQFVTYADESKDTGPLSAATRPPPALAAAVVTSPRALSTRLADTREASS